MNLIGKPHRDDAVMLTTMRHAARGILASVPGMPTGQLLGHVDAIEGETLIGWAKAADHDAPVRVEVRSDGIPIGTVLASEPRRDLLAAGYRSAAHGFRLRLPCRLLDGGDHVVKVRAREGRFRRQVTFPSMASANSTAKETPCKGAPAEQKSVPSALQVQPALRRGFASQITGPDNPTLPATVAMPAAERWKPRDRRVLIAGSAPSLGEHAEEIVGWAGEIWALNDALFWLNEHGIAPDCMFVFDQRFVALRRDRLRRGRFRRLVTTPAIDVIGTEDGVPVTLVEPLGRDGFSTEFGRVFHGCSVLFPALQCAVAAGYTEIATCGVLLSPPGLYTRIDGSTHMPEYVHTSQLQNARRALGALRARGIAFSALEAHSNLRFL